MNGNRTIIKMNQILEANATDEEIVGELNLQLQHIDDDVLGFHSGLSLKALLRMYKIIDEVSIGNDVKEHIVWYYYKRVLQKVGDNIDDGIIESLINDYIKYRFIALESNIVDMIQSHKLTDKQIEKINNVFDCKVVKKNVSIEKTIRSINDGKVLNKNQIEDLIDNEAFNLIEYAIDNNAVSLDELDGFKYPEMGERNRKTKLSIFTKLQKLKNE